MRPATRTWIRPAGAAQPAGHHRRRLAAVPVRWLDPGNPRSTPAHGTRTAGCPGMAPRLGSVRSASDNYTLGRVGCQSARGLAVTKRAVAAGTWRPRQRVPNEAPRQDYDAFALNGMSSAELIFTIVDNLLCRATGGLVVVEQQHLVQVFRVACLTADTANRRSLPDERLPQRKGCGRLW